MREFDVLVIGGGLNGLCAAWWLLRRGVKRVGLVERFTLGHDHGSSHGASRITRSAYADAVYVRLMQVAHAEAWPALEADAATRLIHRRDACLFGPNGGPFQDYLDALAGIDVDVETLDPAEARRRFPVFRFPGDLGVLHDRTAGIVAAADTIAALARIVRAGATVIEGATVLGVDPISRVVDTQDGPLRAERIIVTAGAWAGRLLPGLAGRLTPVRQTVVHLAVDGDAAAFPLWAWRGLGDFYYGLPSFQRPGIKAAKHVLDGPPALDPDAPVDAPETRDVLAFLEEHLVSPPREVLATERCLYTVTDDEDFVLDHHPASAAVTVGAGFSGHGFKFGPLTGRILAELCLDGETTVAPFEAARARFGWGA
ncbi:MAG: FAD-dependent oxidoreductase [Pseudomonadota bacterium]|nr:FAD-dependent oxidoreductase [Pseudomonadota bacterium]